jgi:hypothetical protein
VEEAMQRRTLMGSHSLVLVTLILSLFLSSCSTESEILLWHEVDTAIKDKSVKKIDISTVEKIEKLLKMGNKDVQSEAVLDKLIFSGAGCLNNEAQWEDRLLGRAIYDVLQKYDDQPVIDSLARLIVSEPGNRVRILFFGVKLGTQGTEDKLNEVLMEVGDKEMAEDFLNCGSPALAAGGQRWAQQNGYEVQTVPGAAGRIQWGEF